jgi:hypothetical protein
MELVDNDEPVEEHVDADSEPADARDHPETAQSRIRWAMGIVEDQHRCCQSLLEDLRLSTEAVRNQDERDLWLTSSSSFSSDPSSRMNLPSSLTARTKPFLFSPSSPSYSSRFRSSLATSA